MPDTLSIAVVETDPERATLIEESLRAAGMFSVTLILNTSGLARQIRELSPDVVLIDMANPSRDMLEEFASASGPLERPVAMFVDREDEGMTKAAIEAGVSAYVVAGLRANRIKPILDAAIARFHMIHRMRAELAATKRALDERKIIERAKGVLMKARGIDEDAAYALLRKAAMDQGRRISDVAEALVSTAGLLS